MSFFLSHQFVECIDEGEYAQFAARKPSALPGFCYSGPILNRGAGAVLLGDSIHLVKPYFGLGANSALEDVTVLEDCLLETGFKLAGGLYKALALYSRRRSKEAKALVQMSRTCDNTG
ncbi:unnamed protein product, partial [Phaeothamnion confervicola]